MEDKGLENVWIQDKSMLVENINDYYTKSGDFTIVKDVTYLVGKIIKVGNYWDKNRVGSIVYYYKDIGTNINIKNLGSFTLISDNTILTIIKQ